MTKMKQSYTIPLLVVCVSLTAIMSCCKKDNCPTCPPLPTDSSSHDFVFQQYYYDESRSSILRDAAITNDLLAYAVRQVYRPGETAWSFFAQESLRQS
jgi:hypothetical protein